MSVDFSKFNATTHSDNTQEQQWSDRPNRCHSIIKLLKTSPMKRFFYTLFFCGFSLFLAGQQFITPGENYYDDNKGIVYNKEFSVFAKFHTHGFAMGVNVGTLKTYYLTRFLNFEIGELKHIKEFKQSRDLQPVSNRVSRAYIFGKQNNLYVLRAGFGEKRYLSEKAKRKGLAVGVSYEVGPSLGLLKPYYLELVRNQENGNPPTVESEKYSPENENLFLDFTRIYGSSGFSKGIGELGLIPGAQAKLALHFDWGAFDEFVKAVEAGVMVDFFLQEPALMIETPGSDIQNTPLFINLYINLQFGKRW